MKSISGKINIGLLSTIGVILVLLIVGLCWGISTSNGEIRLRNQANAVQVDLKNNFDLMWKKISQVCQVTKAERQSVEKIIIKYADARNGGGVLGKGSFINAVREALPTVDNKTFLNLQNIIVSSREKYAAQQTKLIDIKREHDNYRTMFPSSLICGSRPELDIKLIFSDKTEDAFETGVDNDVKLDI